MQHRTLCTRQLARVMDATLSLHNRPGGGLEGKLTLQDLS
jgi:hypothetical protein